MWWIVAIIVILLVIALYFVGKYRHLRSLNRSCEESLLTMDLFLKRRYDLVPVLAEAVNAVVPKDSETVKNSLEAVVSFESGKTLAAREAADTSSEAAVKALTELSKEYPELHSNATFLEKEGDLRAISLDIANIKDLYNENALMYNKACKKFPGNIVSSVFKFRLNPLFEKQKNNI